jgi:hypothetical protein
MICSRKNLTICIYTGLLAATPLRHLRRTGVRGGERLQREG